MGSSGAHAKEEEYVSLVLFQASSIPPLSSEWKRMLVGSQRLPWMHLHPISVGKEWGEHSLLLGLLLASAARASWDLGSYLALLTFIGPFVGTFINTGEVKWENERNRGLECLGLRYRM